MAIKFPKINWEKVGAYTFGGLLGAGLSALGWHVMEKRGIDPGKIFKKKVVQGNISYYDPEKDPNLDDMIGDIESLDVLLGDDDDDSDGINEGYVEEVVEDSDGNDGSDGSTDKENRIYQIDRETWYHSEDDEDYKHAEMKYYIDDQQISDEEGKLIRKPWLLIGGDNYDALADENSDREMFVRNEGLETDFVIVRTDGSYDG